MYIRKKALTILTLIAIFFLSGCSSSPKTPEAVITPGSKFVVKEFNLDIVQKLSFPGYLEQEQAQELMKMAFIASLKNSGLQANPEDTNPVPIEVNVYYRRIFTGESTPFPINSLGNIRAIYQIYMIENGQKQSILLSKQRTNNLSSLFKFDKDERDLGLIIATGHDAAKLFEENIPTYAGYVGDTNAFKVANETISSRYNEFQQTPKPAMDRSYIPESITSELFSNINDEKDETRNKAYKYIQEHWFNQPKIFDYISESILSSYSQELSPNKLNELKQQIDTLAKSGLIIYKDTFEQVASSSPSNPLQEYAQNKIKVLEANYIKSHAIHRPLPDGLNLTWKEQQLYNMTIADNLELKRIAVRRIYKEFPKNKILLDTLSEQLETAVHPGYRPVLYADYHAWICRVLGMSGESKYKAQLVRLSTDASSKKVRNFADEYSDEL